MYNPKFNKTIFEYPLTAKNIARHFKHLYNPNKFYWGAFDRLCYWNNKYIASETEEDGYPYLDHFVVDTYYNELCKILEETTPPTGGVIKAKANAFAETTYMSMSNATKAKSFLNQLLDHRTRQIIINEIIKAFKNENKRRSVKVKGVKHYLYEMRKLLPYVLYYNTETKECCFENRDYEYINYEQEISSGCHRKYLYSDASQPCSTPEDFRNLIKNYRTLIKEHGITKLLNPNDYFIKLLELY